LFSRAAVLSVRQECASYRPGANRCSRFELPGADRMNLQIYVQGKEVERKISFSASEDGF